MCGAASICLALRVRLDSFTFTIFLVHIGYLKNLSHAPCSVSPAAADSAVRAGPAEDMLVPWVRLGLATPKLQHSYHIYSHKYFMGKNGVCQIL